MSADWERVEALFHSASELDSTAREAFLDRECSGDLVLRNEVVSMLAFADQTVGPLRTAVESAAVTEAPRVGQRIGPYELLRPLGEGGMGAVYLAVRADDQFRKEVAIKLMHTGFPSARMMARFRLERQIVANLEHPNIARLLDGGATEQGSPYLVMEYVDGVRIDDFCRTRALSISARLELFVQVCEAVSYAHRNLVIHRDLKPGNILVTPEAMVKLVDFGVAKLLNPDDTGPAGTTEMFMTPDYASPEQIRGENITTSTDVYALGVVLYELLAGKRPYELRNASPAEMERAICQTDPPRPSTIEPTLAGDLDTIVMTALHKDQARRYSSVERLQWDTRRYLSGFPVSARPDTWGYRSSKFIRRHTLATALVASLVVVLTGFSIGMAILARRLALQRDVATEQQARSEQVTSFLTDLFKVSDPSEARGNTITAREILDRGSDKIVTDLKTQPKVQVAMLDTVAKVYESLGLYSRAQGLFDQSLAVRKSVLSSDDASVAQGLVNVAGELEIRDKDYQRAEVLLKQALDLRRKTFGDRSIQVAECLDLQGNLARIRGNYDPALADLGKAYDLDRQLLGANNLTTAQVAAHIGTVYQRQGDYPNAEKKFREVLQVREKLLRPDDPLLLDTIEGLGCALQYEGKSAEAEPYFRRVLEVRKKIYGPVHAGVGVALDNLASVLQDEGKLNEAEPLYREAVDILRKTRGDGDPGTAITTNNLAVLLRARGNFQDAETQFRAALAIYRKTLGDDHPYTASCLSNLAVTLLSEKKLDEAEQFARQGLEVRRKRFGESHIMYARSLQDLARIRDAKGDVPGAASFYQQAIDVCRRATPPAQTLDSSISFRFAKMWMRAGKAAQAEPLFANAFKIAAKQDGTDSPDTAEMESEWGLCLAGLKQYQPAETHLKHAYEILKAKSGDNDGRTVRSLRNLEALHQTTK